MIRKNGQEKGRIWLKIIGFEICWGLVIESTVEALAVVEGFAVIKEGASRLAMGGEDLSIDQFEFEGAPEAFHGGIIVARPAGRPHRFARPQGIPAAGLSVHDSRFLFPPTTCALCIFPPTSRTGVTDSGASKDPIAVVKAGCYHSVDGAAAMKRISSRAPSKVSLRKRPP